MPIAIKRTIASIKNLSAQPFLRFPDTGFLTVWAGKTILLSQAKIFLLSNALRQNHKPEIMKFLFVAFCAKMVSVRRLFVFHRNWNVGFVKTHVIIFKKLHFFPKCLLENYFLSSKEIKRLHQIYELTKIKHYL